jgi:hypothetical protein
MDLRAERLTKAVRKHDPELYVERKGHLMCVFRKTRTLEHYEYDGVNFAFSRVSPYFVFALTDNWATTGNPVEWGIEPIIARLRAIDLWNNPSLTEDLLKSYEKRDQEKARERKNNTEAQMAEMYPIFKKAFADINTSTLAKKDRRRLDDKKLKGVY